MALQECRLKPPGWQRFLDPMRPPWLTTQAPWERSRRLIDLTAREDDGNLVDLLLDGDETRSRDLVAREEEAILFITVPHGDGDEMLSSDDEAVQIAPEHLLTLDQEYRWIPAVVGELDQFSIRQMFGQTTNVDDTVSWEYAALRRSRIRVSKLGTKTGVVPRPAAVADLAIDRADLRMALARLSRGELRSLERRFAGKRLSSGQRVQLMRALSKTREVRQPSKDSEVVCKRFAFPVHIGNEAAACPLPAISNEHNGGLDGA